MPVLVFQIADDQGRPVQPGELSEGFKVRDAVHVAEALFPVGKGVAFNHVHFHVNCQQVIAGVHAVLGGVVEEKVGRDPLAHQSAVEIGEHRQHGFDLAAGGLLSQFIEAEHAPDSVPSHVCILLRNIL